MQKIKFNHINVKIIILFFLFYITVLFGFYLNEDTLGGAKDDFNYHYKISLGFTENFISTFNNFGMKEASMDSRNSPAFWILISYIDKFFSYDVLRLINSFVSLMICFVFFQCLKIKYKKINSLVLTLVACYIFLSPTIRSLSIWPYPLIWGLLFFTVSIFYFLKFMEEKREIFKFKQSLLTIFFLVIGAYIYPAFGIFFLFYIFNFFLMYNLKQKFFLLLVFSLFLAIPFLYYIFSKDVFAAFSAAQGMVMNNFNTFNISNKILVISTMILFFVMPILNFKLIKNEISNLKSTEVLTLIIFSLVNIYFFDYPEYNSGFGGGFFYKLSNILFQNNYLFFIFSTFSIIYIYTILKKSLNNSLIFLILILFNPQLTIYNKYYDPLIFIIFMILMNFDIKKHYFEKKYKTLQLYLFGISYLTIGLFKNQVY